MSFFNINKNHIWDLCKNEIEEEQLERLLFNHNLLFKPNETKYGVTKDNLYRFIKSTVDNEYVFIDDNKEESVVWIGVDGDFLIDKRHISEELNKIINAI